ncbi:MAG: hypothetical protein IKK24_00070 [Clostridia bacterium]|nr:hypothetical protein [Clostridia bacterium]
MRINLKKLIAVLLLVSIFLNFCACKDSENQSSEDENSTPVTDIVSNISSEQVSSSPDDTQDPENTENGALTGEKVEAEQLAHKEGLANGIDVSKWQGKIDWGKVKKSGIDFAIVRIGYRGENGKLFKDENADYNIQQAIKAGVLVGVYFFSTAITASEAIAEANFTVSAIKGYSISYPVVYDCEGYENADSRMKNLIAKQRTDNALAFLSTVTNAGYEAMFYGAKSELENGNWETARIEAGYKIWLARYTNPPYPQKKSPDYSGKYDMWQYTNRGTVNGISGNTDMIVSYFTRKLKKPLDSSVKPQNATAPKDKEDLIYTDAGDTVTAKDVVNLRYGAGTNFDIAGTLKNGEKLTRTGIGSNGWSRLSYKGKTVYAITSYLTTDLAYTPPKENEDVLEGNVFTAVKDKVTAKNEVNLRSLPTTNGEIVGSLKRGTYLERTATSHRGWSRLIYNGKTVYAVTNCLTTDKLSPVESETDSSKTDNEPTYDTVSQQVTAKQETNLRNAPTTDGSQIIYTLKNGEYVERIGIGSNGWSKLMYNGQIVYAITSYLEEK